ncbi:YkvA family protein [Xanthobacter sp. KR7-65]|uniref:YkvA family protein n=1 Tax=Xanthobacter sp. KR7-65 TaxID=3156612 RepID=UPI0032B5C3AF
MSTRPFDAATAGQLTDADLSEEARAQAARDEAKVRRGFWRKMRGAARHVPFAEDAVATYYAAFDRETPLKVRATLLAALAYFVLPIDIAPDLLPIIGFGDDAAVLMGALKLISGYVKPEHYDAARDALSGAEPSDTPSA